MNYEKLIQAAVQELLSEATRMVQQTSPATPLPRPKTFELAPGILWPAPPTEGPYWYQKVVLHNHNSQQVESIGWHIHTIIKRCGGQPQKILRALRRIQAATNWCRRRTEGRQRAAQEILRQQKRAAHILEAEIVLAVETGKLQVTTKTHN